MKLGFQPGKIRETIASFAEDEEKRITFQYGTSFALLGVISFVMFLFNVFMNKGALTWVTLAFALLSGVNLFIQTRGKAGRVIAVLLFLTEITLMFSFFIISGNPEGFSAIWISMLPNCSLLLLRRKKGSVFSLIIFLILIFFLWVPFGNSLLQHDYFTDTFRMRFPILYLASFAMAFLLETIRNATYSALQKTRDEYKFLYEHDPLTGIYNRYGFRNARESVISDPAGGHAMAMLDLDHFKRVNDTYGHDIGDDVLLEFVKLVQDEVKDEGIFSRWGGEEFMLLLNKADEAEALCQKIVDRVRSYEFKPEGHSIRLTVSIGLVTGKPGEPMEYTQVLRLADRTLFQAKKQGRDMVKTVPYHKPGSGEADPGDGEQA